MPKYRSPVELGKRYKDIHTGIEGRAVMVIFKAYSKDISVMLEKLDKDDLLSYESLYSERLEPIDGGKKQTYNSDCVLGERYRDVATGIEGVATHLNFHVTACEQMEIEFLNKDGEKIIKEWFDTNRMLHVASGAQLEASKPGGPTRSPGITTH